MKKFNIWRYLILLLVLIVPIVMYVVISGQDNNGGGVAASPDYLYRFDQYDIDIVVDENRSCHITETITVHFDKFAAGITRVIPQKHTIYRADGSKAEVDAWVSNFEIINNGHTENRIYRQYQEGNAVYVELGYSNRRDQEYHYYKYSYDYNLGADSLEGADEFYFNIIGTDWDCKINNITFSVTMPKNFDADIYRNVGATYGAYGSTTAIDNNVAGQSISVEEVGNNTIIRGSLDSLSWFSGLTLRVILPDGYFNVPFFNKALVADIVLVATGILLLFLLYLIWAKWGKDRPLYKPVNFYPPQDISIVNMEWIYKFRVSTKSITAMIVNLAHLGYIRIEKRGENDWALIKLKDYAGDDYYSKKIMACIFGNAVAAVGDTSSATSAAEVPLDAVSDRLSSLATDIIMGKNDRSYRISALDETSRKASKWTSFIAGLFLALAINIPLLISGNVVNIINMFMTIILGALLGVAFAEVYCGGYYIWAIIATVSMSLFMITYSNGIADLPGGVAYFVIAVLIFIVAIIIASIMNRRSEANNTNLDEIIGFRDFLENVEKNKLEELVNEDPEYFYNILPYTYVLDISEKWIKKLDVVKLPMPEWLIGVNGDVSLGDIILFNRAMNVLSTNIRLASMMKTASNVVSVIGSGGSGGSKNGRYGFDGEIACGRTGNLDSAGLYLLWHDGRSKVGGVRRCGTDV